MTVSHNSAHKSEPRIPFAERLSCTIGDAIEASGLSRRTINRLIAAGTLASVKVGDRRLVRVPSLVRLVGGAEGQS